MGAIGPAGREFLTARPSSPRRRRPAGQDGQVLALSCRKAGPGRTSPCRPAADSMLRRSPTGPTPLQAGQGRGWRGGDGVYSLLVKDDPLPSRRKVLFTFGDTLISDINPDDSRVEPLDMVNNTYAILTGEDAKAPGELRFHIEKDEAGRDTSLIEPAEGAFDYAGAGLTADKTYYWMQDWASEGGLPTFPCCSLMTRRSRRASSSGCWAPRWRKIHSGWRAGFQPQPAVSSQPPPEGRDRDTLRRLRPAQGRAHVCDGYRLCMGTSP